MVTTLAPLGVVPLVPPVMMQVVLLFMPVKPLPVKLIVSPPLPVLGVNDNVPAPLTGGVTTNEIETNSAEVSNSTMNRELELRVVNLETRY